MTFKTLPLTVALATIMVVSPTGAAATQQSQSTTVDCQYTEHRTNKASGIGKYATPELMGSAVGAAIGHIAGKGHRDQDAATLAGSLAGLFVGSEYQKRVGSKKVYTTWNDDCSATHTRRVRIP